jgi:hypothetical protein
LNCVFRLRDDDEMTGHHEAAHEIAQFLFGKHTGSITIFKKGGGISGGSRTFEEAKAAHSVTPGDEEQEAVYARVMVQYGKGDPRVRIPGQVGHLFQSMLATCSGVKLATHSDVMLAIFPVIPE